MTLNEYLAIPDILTYAFNGFLLTILLLSLYGVLFALDRLVTMIVRTIGVYYDIIEYVWNRKAFKKWRYGE